MKQSHKTLLLWVLLIMMFLAIWQFLSPDRPPATQVPFSDFMAQVHATRRGAIRSSPSRTASYLLGRGSGQLKTGKHDRPREAEDLAKDLTTARSPC